MELKEVINSMKLTLIKALHFHNEHPELSEELKPILDEMSDALNRLRRIKWRREALPARLSSPREP